jgi:hypothetical protein
MKTKLTLRKLALPAMLLSTLIYQPATSFAQGSAFTYQGRLTDGQNAANGSYDLRFTVYDANAAGNVIAGPLTVSPVDVTNGLFTVRIDFGAGVFAGPPRWLSLEVQPAGGGGFLPLTPRQEVTSSPYAIRAASAGVAADVSAGSVVKSLNTLKDDVTLAAGSNVTITPNGNTLTLAATGTGGSGIWSVNGNNAYYNAGNVGIGTTGPATALEVNGLVRSTRSGIAPQYIQLNGGDSGSIKLTAQSTVGAEKNLFIQNLSGEGTPGANNNIQFDLGTTASPSTKMTINRDGNVGIGTTSPFSKLEVAGDTLIDGQLGVNTYLPGNVTMHLKARSGDDYPFYVRDSSGNPLFTLQAGFNLLSMYGDAQKNSGGTSWGTFSDQRLKQDVRAYEPGLNEVLQLRPVRFRYRDDPKRGLTSNHEEVGFIAQEVREVIPEAVTEGQDGYLTLKADPIHWAAINAIRELDQKVEEKAARIKELEARLERLEQLMNQKSGGAE